MGQRQVRHQGAGSEAVTDEATPTDEMDVDLDLEDDPDPIPSPKNDPVEETPA